MELTTRELYNQVSDDVKKLRKEYGLLATQMRELKNTMRELKRKETKIKETIDQKLSESKLWELYGDLYGRVSTFYKRAMDKIYKTIPNISTKLTMRLIEKAEARGANIFQDYDTQEKLEQLNKELVKVDYSIKRYLTKDTYDNYVFLQRTIMNTYDRRKEAQNSFIY